MIPKPERLPSGSYRLRVMVNGKSQSITDATPEACLARYYEVKNAMATVPVGGSDYQIGIKSALINQLNAKDKRKKLTVHDVKSAKAVQKLFPQSINAELIYIDKMSGADFEVYCSSLLSLTGLFPGSKFSVTQKTNDYGADIVINHPNKKKTVIQCKRMATNVSIDAVQEIYAAKAHYNADRCGIITNSTFTPQAVVLASDTGVTLLDRQALATLIQLERDNLNSLISSQWDTMVSKVFPQESETE